MPFIQKRTIPERLKFVTVIKRNTEKTGFFLQKTLHKSLKMKKYDNIQGICIGLSYLWMQLCFNKYKGINYQGDGSPLGKVIEEDHFLAMAHYIQQADILDCGENAVNVFNKIENFFQNQHAGTYNRSERIKYTVIPQMKICDTIR